MTRPKYDPKYNAKTFALDLQRFAKKASAVPDQVLRKVVFDITREIAQKTPVDTGHARSNWFWGVQVVSDEDATLSKSGAPSLARAESFASTVRSGGVVYLTNNLPYIMALEFGAGPNPFGHGSQQAPAGMVRITVARWQSIVDRAARKL
jgi:hypothetical protein